MMTSGAKSGLLLGLIFIVSVAIVLKGVNDQASTPLEDVIVGDQPVPTSPDQLVLAVQQLDRIEPMADDAAAQESFVTNTVAISPQAGVTSAGHLLDVPIVTARAATDALDSQHDSSTALYTSQDVRYELELPDAGNPDQPASDALTQRLSQEVSEIFSRAVDTIRDINRDDDDHVVVINPSDLRSSRTPDTVVPPDPIVPADRAYTVKDGEDLSRVSLAVYGPVEGNRWGNVMRIYKANKHQLASMDKVLPGQVLIIPSLDVPAAAGTDSARVNAVGSASRVYIVQEGDSYWKIAKKMLGSGIRYAEILELNKLKENAPLQIGRRLKLPAK